MKFPTFISQYLAKLKSNIFFQNIAVVAGGNAASKLIGIVSAPIITRLYTPEDYGIYSVFISIVGIAASVATLRYAVTIPIAKDEKLADDILKLCFLITISLSLLWTLGIFLFGNYFLDRFDAGQIKPYLWLLPIVFLGVGIYEALSSWAVRERKFRLITRTKITQGVTSAGVKIGFGALGITPLGLFVGHITQEAAGIGSLFAKLKQLKPAFFKSFSWPDIKYAAKRYKKFPLVQSWSQFLLALGVQLPVCLMGAFFGAKVAGVYGLANSMINLPMNLIGQSVSQVYYAEISKYGKQNPEKIYGLSVSIIKKLFWIGLIPVGILLAFGPWLFKLVFGPEWSEAGKFAQFLSILVLTRFILSPIANIFNIYEKQSLQLTLNIIRLLLVFAAFYTSSLFKLSALNSVVIYSFVMTIYYGILSIIVLRVVKKNIV